MKKCGKCLLEKEESEFAINNKTTGKLNSYCKNCNKEYSKTHYQNNKTKYYEKNKIRKAKYKKELTDFLSDKVCKDCGISDIRVLEFDHVIGVKEFNIADKCGYSPLKNLMKEIDKCEIVCANCHRIRTYERLKNI